ncbi:formate--tetrahydrofolate ligase, partial [Brevibacterium paucivorans]|uniref:formate--tetrahydrofolate ligase n=1 Tax=Brevibacterium paucivorans TaxID=170994 RepID=UPI0021554ABB
YGIPTVVAVNRFPSDTDAELEALKTELDNATTVAIADHWAKGGAGAIDLAHAVIEAADGTQPQPKFAYELDQPLEDTPASWAHQPATPSQCATCAC